MACPKCGGPMLGRCRNPSCGYDPDRAPPPPRKRNAWKISDRPRPPQASHSPSTPDEPVRLTFPEWSPPRGRTPIEIPPNVHHRLYGGTRGSTSLERYLGYSRQKKYTDEQRRVALRTILYSGPFAGSGSNNKYVKAFGRAGTAKRASFLLQMLGTTLESSRAALEEKGHKHHEAALKLKSDIDWLAQEIDRALVSKTFYER